MYIFTSKYLVYATDVGSVVWFVATIGIAEREASYHNAERYRDMADDKLAIPSPRASSEAENRCPHHAEIHHDLKTLCGRNASK
jgi:hypothetical protein